MAQRPPAQPLLTNGQVSTVLAVLVVLSTAVYGWQSRAVRIWIEQFDYLLFVLTSYMSTPRAVPLTWLVPVTGVSVVANVLSLVCAVGAAWAVRRRFAPHRCSDPLGIVAGLVVYIVPPMLLACIQWPDGGGWVRNEVLFPLHLVCAMAVFWGVRRTKPLLDLPASSIHRDDVLAVEAVNERADPWRWIAVATGAVLAVAAFLAGLSGIQGYDSFSDHVSRPARWLVTGRLELGQPEEVVTFYPGNFELLVRWTLGLGTDRLSFLPSYLSAAGIVWCVYRIARDVGLSVRNARVSALACASLQVLAYQAMVVYSDSFTAFCLLLATWLLIIWRQGEARELVLTVGFGAAIGLALGAKYSAGPAAVALGLLWCWYALRDRQRDGFEQPLIDLRWFAPQLAVVVLSVLPGMFFWYLRNTLLEGNPVYPLSVAGLPGIPLGGLLAGGPSPQTAFERWTYPWRESGHVLGFETGLGATVAGVGLLGILVSPWFLHRKRGGLLLWVVWLAVFAGWLQTGQLVPRYGLFPLALGMLFVGVLVEAYPARVLRGLVVLISCVTMIGVSFQLAGGAAYNGLFHVDAPPVPKALASLPATSILNLAAQPTGYYAMGPDYRHRVLTPFRPFYADDVKASQAHYLILPESREPEFAGVSMRLVERWARPNWPSTSLWQLR